MNTRRFEVQPLKNAKSFERNDIVTRPFYGASATASPSALRILLGGGLILGLGLFLALKIGKKT